MAIDGKACPGKLINNNNNIDDDECMVNPTVHVVYFRRSLTSVC